MCECGIYCQDTGHGDCRYMKPPAECDCCGRMAELTQTWACGLGTWACDECRGGLDHVAPEAKELSDGP